MTLLHHLIIIIVFAIIVGVAMSTGLHKGIKIVGESNTIISVILLILMIILGPTLFILHLFVESLGSYLFNLFLMGFYIDSTSMIAGFSKCQES